jgi:hypothetical protein
LHIQPRILQPDEDGAATEEQVSGETWESWVAALKVLQQHGLLAASRKYIFLFKVKALPSAKVKCSFSKQANDRLRLANGYIETMHVGAVVNAANKSIDDNVTSVSLNLASFRVTGRHWRGWSDPQGSRGKECC